MQGSALPVRGGNDKCEHRHQQAITPDPDLRRWQPITPGPDLRRDGERGIDAIRRLKQVDSTICSVLVSASMTIPQAVAAVHAGADDCDVKPLDPRRLLRRIEFGPRDEAPDHVLTLAEVEYEHIARVMDDCAGNISHAARALRLHRQSLQRKLRRDRKTSEESDSPPLSDPLTASRRAS
jgi:two-component system response regulator RegA